MSEELTPQERMLKGEGDALMKAIRANGPKKSTIVGADGEAFTMGESVPAAEIAKISPQQEREFHRVRSLTRFQKILDSERGTGKKPVAGDLEKVYDVMFACHKLLFWARMEMANHPDIADEMITDIEMSVQSAIYHDAKGFDLQGIAGQLKHGVVKIVDDFVRKYQDQGKVRGIHIKKIKDRLGDKGITLPGKIRQSLTGPLMPGRVMVLTGTRAATQEALALFAKTHVAEDKATVFHLTTSDILTKGEGITYMHRDAWENAASKISSLNERLEVVTESDCMMVVIDDLDLLYTEDPELGPDERKMYALKRAYQWAVENLVAVVVADTTNKNPDQYGFLPSFEVQRVEQGGKMVLQIGTETF